jgi:putative hydrolase of the HAD superfamily
MDRIKAIGFDLFNTLLTVNGQAVDEAVSRLIRSLLGSSFALEEGSFRQAYRETALQFMEGARLNGRETHNRFWISAALKRHGYVVDPDDPRIAAAVDAYFSAFPSRCQLIPGTLKILRILRGHYRLGLLSNFIHPPAARGIIDWLGLTPFFEVVLISGELGYRKPHPMVFRQLIERFGVRKDQVLYIGDDPEPDIIGAEQAGVKPVWFTYVRDNEIPIPPALASSETEKPEGGVTRISSWKELLPLLGKRD